MKVLNKPVLFTCEHGGNRIPPHYFSLFKGKSAVLESHRGWDPGALELAKQLAADSGAPLIFSETSRLLVDLNRSLHHHNLFSEFSRQCDAGTKQHIIDHYYVPYRQQVENAIDELFETHRFVLHYSIHSFTPRLDNYQRKTDIGLLYDPRNGAEQTLCINMQKNMQKLSSRWLVRRNYPYRGNADGLTTFLRKKHAGQNYYGIEIEVNQKYVGRSREWESICNLIASVIKHSINAF